MIVGRLLVRRQLRLDICYDALPERFIDRKGPTIEQIVVNTWPCKFITTPIDDFQDLLTLFQPFRISDLMPSLLACPLSHRIASYMTLLK
ncbi:hypothetical protein WI23_11415 [Burkholderia oklahomensis C6786]|nr:hypothetical protein WI23_11415 [Burkholderia oklahomensis C6786]KUY56155.1 hypothetical protein WI23_19715 [Burkholderia oklahomensis C6786]